MKLDTDGLDGVLYPPRAKKVSRPKQRGGVGRLSAAVDPAVHSKKSVSPTSTADKKRGTIAPKRPSPMPPSILSRGKTLAYIPAVTAGAPSNLAPPFPVTKTITTPAPEIRRKRTEDIPSANRKETIVRDIGAAFSKTIETPAEAINIDVTLDSDPETLGVSSNLGRTQRGRPVVMSTIPPASVPKRDTLLDTIVSVSPEDVADRYPKTESKRRRFRPLPLVVVVLIAFSAAFFGRAFLSRREAPRSAVQTVASADRDAQNGDKAVSTATAPPSMTFEEKADDADPDKAVRASVVALSSDETAPVSVVASPEHEDASNAVRFPGKYQKGETHPDIAHWGQVDRVFQSIRKCKKEIIITGYTCDLGDEETNRVVSEKRAEIVSRYFIKRGFNRSRLVVQGMGSSQPIVENETEEGRMLNRRVEILCR